MLDNNLSNEQSRFRTKYWVEINDESKELRSVNSDNSSKATILRTNLWDYADSYILFKGTITITVAGADVAAKQADERDKNVIFKNYAPFTKCMSRINGIDINNAQDIDMLMPMRNLIEYSDKYLKTSGSLWQYYIDN